MVASICLYMFKTKIWLILILLTILALGFGLFAFIILVVLLGAIAVRRTGKYVWGAYISYLNSFVLTLIVLGLYSCDVCLFSLCFHDPFGSLAGAKTSCTTSVSTWQYMMKIAVKAPKCWLQYQIRKHPYDVNSLRFLKRLGRVHLVQYIKPSLLQISSEPQYVPLRYTFPLLSLLSP